MLPVEIGATLPPPWNGVGTLWYSFYPCIIGLAFLGTLGGLAQALTVTTDGGGFIRIVRESLIIGGWVAMWRPLEVFLYDWWPILARARQYDRLATMPIRIHDAAPGDPRRFANPAGQQFGLGGTASDVTI